MIIWVQLFYKAAHSRLVPDSRFLDQADEDQVL